MGLEDMKPRTAFLLLVGSAITILFIMSCTSLWRNNYHEAVLFLVLGAGLTFVFFRKRILVLASIGCAFLLVSAGLTAIFHPSVAGILLTIGSLIGLIFFCRWLASKHPDVTPNDWQELLDNKSECGNGAAADPTR